MGKQPTERRNPMKVGDLVRWKAYEQEVDIGIIIEVDGNYVKVIWSREPEHNGVYRFNHEQMERVT